MGAWVKVPVLLERILTTAADGTEQLHNLAEGGGSPWGVDDRVLRARTVTDVMWVNRFPLFF